ncbi:conserved hypothetical protein [Psychromonas ingrahamii 37]|uniref:DUF1040 family protein n=1 Tax=Psychromonas ingrahamii (strain DSM 17664 / CCUG 51855 / 37) TaxID=357804 RepID=A1SR29_PSYIN|nr:YihD family protein [Psychromonas ingrahamii]ABM01944.1 conserved hypothetical protein [Psychromonas ingrahamii 37]
MQSDRINKVIELLKPYWLKNKELSLIETLVRLTQESGFDKPLEKLNDEVIIYHLKMDQIEANEMLPGIAKDCKDDFKTALLQARGLI